MDSEEGANEIKDKCELILERINIAEPVGETTEPIFNGSVLTLQSLSNKLVEYITKASSRRAASHMACRRARKHAAACWICVAHTARSDGEAASALC